MLRIAQQENKVQRLPHIEFLKEPPARKGFLELAKFEELIAQFSRDPAASTVDRNAGKD